MTYQVKQMLIGVNGFPVQVLLIDTDNTVAEVLTTGYLGPAFNFSDVTFSNKQLAIVSTTDGGTASYSVSVDSNGLTSLEPGDDNPTAVNIHGAPVVAGHLAAFYGTDGTIQDLGFSPSNASKTKVVMATAETTVNAIPKFTDIAGTVGNGYTPSDAAKTTAAMASGTFVAGNFVQAGDTAGSIVPGPAIPANQFLSTGFATPDVSSNLIAFQTTISTTTLASSGIAPLFTSSTGKQYKIVNMWLNFGANLLVGNRNLTISDGTTTYSVIPTASLATMVNAGWGSTAVPYPASAAIDTSTVAGANLQAQYSGGTTDYTNGENITISGILQRVA